MALPVRIPPRHRRLHRVGARHRQVEPPALEQLGDGDDVQPVVLAVEQRVAVLARRRDLVARRLGRQGGADEEAERGFLPQPVGIERGEVGPGAGPSVR
jgi:hypothetical protein